MKSRTRAFNGLICALALASCSAPPKPPVVDPASKRPANVPAIVELQICRNDLHDARLLAAKSDRLAQANAEILAQLSQRQQSLAAAQEAAAHQREPRNRVFTVLFAFGSADVAIPSPDAQALVEAARLAPLVLLRGRTDGSGDSLVETRMARARAIAVRDYLVAAGVAPQRIRTTYQPTGDHAADNDSAAGRAVNRRVEVELYPALPLPLGPSQARRP